MKKILSFAVASFLAGTSVFSVACAQDTAVLNESKLLEITQVYDTTQKLTLTIAPAMQSHIDSDNLPLMMYLYDTDSEGNFEMKLPLPQSWQSGKYTLYIDSADDTRKQDFIYINLTDADTLNTMLSLNQAQSGTELAQLLSVSDEMGDNASKIGIDTSSQEYIKYGTNALEYCLSQKTVDYSVDTFLTAYNQGITIELALESLRNADSQDALKTLIEENYALLGINMDGDYKALKAKEQVFAELFNHKADLTTTLDAQKAFDNAIKFVVVNSVKNAESYGDIRAIIEESYSLYNIDLTGDYASVKDKYKVFAEMFENKNAITDSASVKKCFDDAVSNVLDSEAVPVQKPVSGGSSSGGGGGGGGTISLPSTAPSTAPSVDNAPQVTPPSLSANTYSDMNGHFALEAVKSLSSKNIISGYPDGSFKPDNQVTRAEFAKMAAVAFGIEKADATSFDDVSPSDWFAGYVGALSAKEVLKGYDGKFNPNAPITRQDAACVIYRLMSTHLTSTSSSDFADASDISSYAKDAVASLRAAGIVNGSENKFLPLSNITRGEAAVMFSNAINIQK